MGIEHPDHTGSSSNPRAPWNQADYNPKLLCDTCLEEPVSDEAEFDGPCENVSVLVKDGKRVAPCNGHYIDSEK